jgi:hypothetical protein
MSVASFITRSRRRQADLFDGTCTIARPDPATITGPSGDLVFTTTAIYSGACLARPATDGGSARPQTGDERATLTRYLVKVPVDTAAQLGDTVTVTASTYDADLVGVTGVVVAVAPDEWQISRRLTIEQQG